MAKETMAQKKLKATMSKELKNFYALLQSFVAGGNCLVETGDKIHRVEAVEIAAVHDKITGFVFTT